MAVWNLADEGDVISKLHSTVQSMSGEAVSVQQKLKGSELLEALVLGTRVYLMKKSTYAAHFQIHKGLKVKMKSATSFYTFTFRVSLTS